MVALSVVLTILVVDGAPYPLFAVALLLLVLGVRGLFARGERDPAADGVAARLERVDATCDALLADLRASPPSVRAIVGRPEGRVRELRDGLHALAARERELRALARPEDDARLAAERADLQERLAGEQDAGTRDRLGEALAALDRQRAQRAEVLTSASRLEAERVRLLYTLEALQTQVRALNSSAGTDPAALEALRGNLDRLSDEVSAVAGALASVQAVDPGATGATGREAVPSGRDPLAATGAAGRTPERS